MKSRLKRWTVICVGWMFILLGIAGLFLPVLQGVLFLLIGLLILSTEYVWAHRLLYKLRERFPRLGHMLDKAEARARHWLEKLGWHHHKERRPAPTAVSVPPNDCR